MITLARLWLAHLLLWLGEGCTLLARRLLRVPPEIDPLARDRLTR